MAPKNKNRAAAGNVAPGGVDMQALSQIASGKLTHVTAEIGQPMVAAGLIAVDGNDSDGKNGFRATMTEAGITALKSAGMNSSPAEARQPAFKFEVDDYVYPITEKPKRGRTGESKYNFDALAVGKSFHIPATTERPEPHKSYSSLVAQAKKKYAVPVKDASGNPIREEYKTRAVMNDDGTVKTPARTATRDKMEYTRDFSLREALPDDPKGKGARFIRIK